MRHVRRCAFTFVSVPLTGVPPRPARAFGDEKRPPGIPEREYSASAVLTDILFLMYNYQRGIRGALSGSKIPPFVRIFGDVPHAECPVFAGKRGL